MWLLRAGGCLAEVNISTKLKLRNIQYGCLRQVGCLIKVTTQVKVLYFSWGIMAANTIDREKVTNIWST